MLSEWQTGGLFCEGLGALGDILSGTRAGGVVELEMHPALAFLFCEGELKESKKRNITEGTPRMQDD
jgi:hypothetical protein